MSATTLRAGLAASALVLTVATAWALTFPALSGRVVDQAGIIPPDKEAALTGKLAALEVGKGHQLVVVTLNSLEGTDIADYGVQLGRHWGIGRAAEDDGVMLVIAPNEREVRIEVGYGLEGTLTDAVTGLIIQNDILPRFRADDMAGGIERGVDDIIEVLSDGATALQQRAVEEQNARHEDIPWPVMLFMLIVITLIVINFVRDGGGPGMGLPGGISRGGSSGGFSRSSGSSGGFSGRGGSFGGGGSSGRW